jgi:hypothetical protein
MSTDVPDASGAAGRTNAWGEGVDSIGRCEETTAGFALGLVKGSRPIAWARDGGLGCRFPPPPPPACGPGIRKKIKRGGWAGAIVGAAGAGLGTAAGLAPANTTAIVTDVTTAT